MSLRKARSYFIALVVCMTSLSLFTANALARIDPLSNSHMVVLSETNLLNDYKNPNSVTGSISGIQVVQIACTPYETKCLATSGDKDYVLIKTWMGDKWIEDNDNITGGGYSETARNVTLVEDTQVYDRPFTKSVPPADSDAAKLTPQKVHVKAIYQYLPKGHYSGRAMLDAPVWYLISTTYRGEKWIVDPFFPEDVEQTESPSDRAIKLNGNEMLYDFPHVVAGKGIKAPSGIVQVVARNTFQVKSHIDGWYKIQLQEGTFKWVKAFPQDENESTPLTQLDLVNESIALRTATRYFDIDGEVSLSLQNWLQPGKYAVDRINDGWARIQTPDGWKVVNLDRAPLERPPGIIEAQEKVKLTPKTATYYFPLTGEVSQSEGAFSDQEAVSFEKWVSPLGVNWYHISTYNGIAWVPEQPIEAE